MWVQATLVIGLLIIWNSIPISIATADHFVSPINLANYHSNEPPGMAIASIRPAHWTNNIDQKKMPRDIQRTIKTRQFTYAEHLLLELTPQQIEQVAFDLHALGPGGTDNILELISKLTQIKPTYYLLNGLYKGMQAKNLLEPYGLIRLANDLQREVMKQSNKDTIIAENADKLLDSLLSDLIHTTGQAMADAMLNKKYNNTELVNKLCKEIDLFKPDIRAGVMDTVIAETYDLIPAQLIFDHLNTNKELSLRLNGYLALFWKLKNTAHIDDQVVVQITAKLYEIENDERYGDLSDKELHDIDTVKENLPDCLKNLFFEGIVCILSATHKEYVYAANVTYNFDDERRSVFSWIPGMPILGSYWIVDRIGTQLFFKNRDRHMEYLTASKLQYDADLRYVFTWTPGGEVSSKAAWTVQTKENSCYFRNVHFGEYLISSLVVNEGMRGIFTWQSRSDGVGELFEWRVMAC